MAFPQGKVTLYFQLITKRSFAEAERILADLKKHAASTEWSKGYLSALDGLIIALKSNNDKYTFIQKVEFEPKKLAALQNEFSNQPINPLNEGFDKGFFSAWTDYLRVLSKWKPSKALQPKPPTPMEATNPHEDKSAEEITE